MRNKLIIIIWLLLLPISYSHAHFIIENEDHHDQVKDALERYNNGDLAEALEISQALDNKVYRNSMIWLILMEVRDDESLQGLINFYENNSSWPFKTATRRRIEQSFNEKSDPELVVQWFDKYPPITNKGQKIYLRALSNSDSPDKAKIAKLVKSIWHESSLTEVEERLFERKYDQFITQDDHIERIDNLIWTKKYSEARKLIRHLDSAHAHLFNARLAYLEDKTGKELLLKLVPKKLSQDPGLLYSIILRSSEDDDHEAYDRYFDKIRNFDSMKNTDKWCNLVSLQIRNLLEDESYEEAYELSLKSCRHNNVKAADAEFLSGWIALRNLENVSLAKEHFTRLVEKVKMPISASRAAYWLARAHQKSGGQEEARHWYLKASDYPFTFYGQLALEELGHKKLTNFFENKLPKFSEDELKILSSNINLNIAYIVSQSKWYELAHSLIHEELEKADSMQTKYMIVVAGKMFGRMDLSLVAAKKAMYHNVTDYESAYPYIKEGFMKRPVLVNSLTRQESLFNKNAVSSAGALGLMQLMPKTASMTARQLGVRYDEASLTQDPKYNLKLGSHHIDELHKDFGSNILAIAAYNAGDTPIKKWIHRFGDPRKLASIYEIVDWIEQIPYCETRNYVQRVIENMQIYSSIIDNKKDFEVTISQDLRE